ncbi:MAG: RHS repeat protein, partial [Myxococcaceae bacterium]
TLSYDAPSDTWTWRDGDTGTTETYRLSGAGNYRVTRVTDTEGHYVEVSYSGALISQIAAFKAGGTATGVIKLTYDGTKLQSTEYLENGVRTRSLTRYDYDGSGRLWHVITDLSPEDGIIAYASVYTLTYGYEGAAVDARLNSIQQTDGTQITIGYESGTGRVTSVLDGRGLGTTFTYDAAGTTTVKDALGQATKLKYGTKGELLEVSGAVTGGSSFIQKYTYDPATGDLWTSTNAKNETTTCEYNGEGALLRRTDAAGNVLERTYTSDGLVASETLYRVPDPDGVAGASKASAPLTTNYYYDTVSGHRRLQYVIYGDGSVASYIYDNVSGQLTDTFKYSPDVIFSGNRQIGSEVSTFAANAFKTDKGLVRTHHEYDLRGMLNKERTYATSTYNAATNGFDSTDATDTLYTYDPSGRLLSRQDASGVKLAYEYDGLGRVTKTLDTNLVATIYSYSDTARETRIKLDNGQTTVQVFNRWGELISSDVLGAGNTPGDLKKLGGTSYSYDNLGRLWRTTDATGVSVFSLYDVSGRKSADIAANGQLTEYLYDGAGRLIQQIAYVTPLLHAALNGLTSTNTVASVRPTTQFDQDRITTYYYDAAARLTGLLDADGYLTQTKYDGTGAVTSQTTYANAVAVTRLDVALGTTRSSAPVQPSPTWNAGGDRTVRKFYDVAGRLVAQVDGDGGLTRWTYDAAGNRLSQLRRSL